MKEMGGLFLNTVFIDCFEVSCSHLCQSPVCMQRGRSCDQTHGPVTAGSLLEKVNPGPNSQFPGIESFKQPLKFFLVGGEKKKKWLPKGKAFEKPRSWGD